MRNTVRRLVGFGLLAVIALAYFSSAAIVQRAADRISFQAYAINPSEPSVKANGTPLKVRRGQVVHVVVEGMVKPGFYSYPTITAQVIKNYLELSPAKGLELLGDLQETPAAETLELHKNERIHRGVFTWTQKLLVKKDIEPGLIKQLIDVSGQVCNEKSCVPFSVPLEVSFDVSPEKPLDVDGGVLKDVRQYAPPAAVGNDVSRSSSKKSGENREIIYGLINSSKADYKATMEDFATSGKIENNKISISNSMQISWPLF